MDTERWQILLRAIDRGSLRAAADEMDVTVSGISRSVATLEKELGFSLLYRAKSGVQPTEECRQLLPSVRELLFAQERLEQIAAKVRDADCGTIVIGTAYNCYYEWVTQMMAAFRTRHPGVVIKIVNEELCALMGGQSQKLNIGSKSPSVVMLVGLQGAGKTTNGAKLAALMRKSQCIPSFCGWRRRSIAASRRPTRSMTCSCVSTPPVFRL